MDFQRWVNDMRTRTALVLFLTSIVLGGLLTFALGAIAAAGDPSPKVLVGKGTARREARSSSDQGLAWRDFGRGLSEAKAQRKRILVDVYTDWCGWCKRMDRDTYSEPEVQKYLSRTFVPVRLNAEAPTRVGYKGNEYSYRQLASGFRVTGYPTALFLESDGTHIVSAPGYMKATDFLSVLRFIGDGHYKNQDFQQYMKEQEQASAPGSPAR
jgi:thioredoxin-related protein